MPRALWPTGMPTSIRPIPMEPPRSCSRSSTRISILPNMLLDKGADPNIADETGMAALYAAVDMHTLGAMISRPAPKLVDNLDAADLVKLCSRTARIRTCTPAQAHDRTDITTAAMQSLGDGTTPLMRAAKANDIA